MSNQYSVSVILPVYNTERYLRQCLDSLVNQTLSDIEIICIDDGSTDGSHSILQEYARADSRVIVLTQANQGAGVARNKGLEIARGDYLYIADSDDYFELSLLEETVNYAKENDADIVIFKVNSYDMKTQDIKTLHWAFRSHHFSSAVFSYHDAPDYIFNSFQNWTWNKIFKRSFVEENTLRFQPLRRTNDLFFTCCAMTLAKPIALLNQSLMVYRVGQEANCQATNHLFPFDFYKALLAFKEWLEQNGYFDELKKSYSNLAMRSCIYNLNSIQTPKAYCDLYEFLQSEGFHKLGFDQISEFDLHDNNTYANYLEVLNTPVKEYLFNHWKMGVSHKTSDRAATESASLLKRLKKKYSGLRTCFHDHGVKYTLCRAVEHLGIPMNAELPTKRTKNKHNL